MKGDLSQKSTRKYDIFFKRSENMEMVFSKRVALGHDLSSIIWKDGVFFRKHDIFSLDRKWEMIFLKKYMEIWYFLCTRTGVTNVVSRPSGKKYPRSSYRAKIHLKMIGVLDWYPRAPAILRTFMETFTGISCIALQRKKPGNLIYRIEVWLLLQFIRLQIFYNEWSSILCTIQPSGAVFGGVLERQ